MTLPLVSCVMPTRGRPYFVRQAYTLWARQTWPERELVVVVDEDDPKTLAVVNELVAADPRVRAIRVPEGTVLGDKWNRGVEAAAGDYVAHMGDDDWYSAEYLKLHVEPLIAGCSEMNWTPVKYLLDLVARVGWVIPAGLYGPHAGTLMYQRSVWGAARYPAIANDEDTGFIERATKVWQYSTGADVVWSAAYLRRRWYAAVETLDAQPRIRVVPGLADHWVYVRHQSNVTRNDSDGQTTYRQLAGFRPGELPIPTEERGFYLDVANAIRTQA